MRIFVDATTLIALGTIGELDLLNRFDGEIVVPPAVATEVTTEPAATNLEAVLASNDVDEERTDGPVEPPTIDPKYVDRAKSVLDESDQNGDVQLIAEVLRSKGAESQVAIVSDDKRVRTVARGFGARVTGTIGVVVRAVDDGLSAEDGKDLVRRIDEVGLHMTGELRDRAFELIEETTDG